MRTLPLLFCVLLLPGALCADGLRPDVRQVLVGVASGWDASSGTLAGFRRGQDGSWKPDLGPFPALFGKNGLAWGRGVLGTGEPGIQKAERDKRAPAGAFALGKIYTYDPVLPAGAEYPFHTVTGADAWVDDPALPEYNRHVAVDPKNPPPWFSKQRMRQNDFAYRWLIEIRHNADPPQPGRGSAIFFHIRRGETRPTSGCTTLAQSDLVSTIRWLRAPERPHYVLLPRAEYARKWRAWGLPDPSLLRGAVASRPVPAATPGKAARTASNKPTR